MERRAIPAAPGVTEREDDCFCGRKARMKELTCARAIEMHMMRGTIEILAISAVFRLIPVAIYSR